MQEILRTSGKGPYEVSNSAMATPAANSTTSDSISAEYMYAIIGVYAVIIIIVFITVSFILFKRLRGAFCPPRHKATIGYVPLPQEDVAGAGGNRDELNRVVDIHGDSDSDSDDSDYDNISLDPGRTYEDQFGSGSEDIPPYYEQPPSYVPNTRG